MAAAVGSTHAELGEAMPGPQGVVCRAVRRRVLALHLVCTLLSSRSVPDV